MAAYLQRARFIAIAEFGPRSLIYHEGRAYRVYRAKLPPGVRTQDGGKLATASLFICDVCGGVHQPDEPERCHTCGGAMAGTHPIRNVLRIDNVETVPPGLGTESSYDSLLEGGVTSELVSEIPKFPASWERTGNFDRLSLASR